MAYVDKENETIRKFEGNPYHPGSRGKNCAKGPATINQIKDTDRILYPLKRTGKRGEGGWERVSWDNVLDDIAAKRPFKTKGVSPMDFENIIGKKVNQEVCLDKLITENILYD